jgi:hypothetical protein
MIFLVAYDRRTQKLLREIEVFDDEHRADAKRRRLEVEIRLPKEEQRYEVVLLEARSRAVLEETHARYFSDLRALVESAKDELGKISARLHENVRAQKKQAL